MNRTALYVIAWVGVPIAFAGYIHLAYSWSLAQGQLPFLGPNELKWWIAFVVAPLLGGACVMVAQRGNGAQGVLWSALYVLAMAAVLLGIHLGVACGHGDCF